MKCEACGVELDGGREVRDGETDYVIHGPARCRDALKAQLDEARRERDELHDDRHRALKRADPLTLDTQTCDEAVAALYAMVTTARAQRDAATAKLAEAERERDEARSRVKDIADDLLGLHAARPDEPKEPG